MGISIGIVGLGAFGSQFVRYFKSHPLVDRIALCDQEADRIEKFASDDFIKEKFNVSDAYASLDEILKSDIDAIALFTQHWMHAPQAIQVMEAGKHVYSAVPIISVPDADEILDWCDKLVKTCRRTGQRYMLGETTYFHPGTMYCRKKAAEGAFGDFVYAEGEYYHDVDWPACSLREVHRLRTASSAGKGYEAILAEYAKRGARGGPMEYPTHSTSGPISVMGAHTVKVTAIGTPSPAGDDFFTRRNDVFCNEMAFYEMSNGAAMRICECRKIGTPGDETFRIFGTEASFRENTWETIHGKNKLEADELRDPLPPEVYDAFKEAVGEDVYGGHNGSHAYLVNEFVEAIANDRLPAINVWEAVRYMAAGAAAHKSALRGGERLDVPDWGDAPV